MSLHQFNLDITLEYIIPWLKQTARFEVQPKDSVLHKGASRFTTGGIERQPSIVVIYWLQSQGVFMTHAHTIRIGLNSETVAPEGEEGNPFNSSHAETRWNKAGTTWKGKGIEWGITISAQAGFDLTVSEACSILGKWCNHKGISVLNKRR